MTTKLLWIPADLPPFPITDKFLLLSKDDHFACWSFTRLTQKQPSAYDITWWNPEFEKNFTEIVEWFNNLPIKNIRNIKFNIQTTVVHPHIDFTNPDANMELWTNNHDNDPCGYRVLINGARSNKLYVVNSANEKIYCCIPPTTNTYLLRHSDGYHGVDEDENRLVVFIHIEVEPGKHAAILERSLSKYASYAIYDI